ncbi:DeoR/GlpR family DNA-binding transcription regulator [Thermicanus aegyptius]|uniref:DeoR/GlpR family DNA-binding transcription regulator n=1 Tax=Thermicanus aegyptius TaxID=94009 RepID=UPI0004263CC6|nr:DeoR/GlpR family DNA-binding transcription regulator [Thermicanus aegyptius]
MSIEAIERREEILRILQEKGKVRGIELSIRFAVSPETIRRDLEMMEQEGIVKRVYGGAVLIGKTKEEAPYLERQRQFQAEKRAIGKFAAQMIGDGESILIDVGTTTLELAKAIRGGEGVTVLTNSLSVVNTLDLSLQRGQFQGEVMVLGGTLNPAQQSIRGSLTERMIENFYVDKAFISVGGITLHEGLSDYDLQESLVTKAMMKAAKQVIVLADHSKLGIKSFYRLGRLEEADIILCDQEPPESWRKQIKQLGIEWIKVEVEDEQR